MMRNWIIYAYRINYTKPHNIDSMLGFSSNRVLELQQWQEADRYLSSTYIVRIECNVTAGAYSKDRCTRHTRVCRQHIRHRKSWTKSFTFRALYRASRIWQFAWWTKTIDCLIFTEKRLPLDCMYGGDNVLILNEQLKQIRDTHFIKRLH